MSAESPKCPRSQLRQSGGGPTVVPQQVTDPTILDSVAGFIHEVVPNSYNVPFELKDQIQWAHFEHLECDESTFAPNYDCEKIIPPPLILVLGYTTGIQVWCVPANGEASEIISWRHGSCKVLKILPTPYKVGSTVSGDYFLDKRPLLALCDSASPGPQYCALSFLSIKTGEQVKLIKFKNPILNVFANRHSVVVSFLERIAVFDAFTLEDRCTVTTCYLSPGIQPNPIVLGQRWMAYAEKKLNLSRRSSGGNDSEGVQSYTATVLHAAKSLGRGLRELSETVASSLTGSPHGKPGTSPGSPQAGGVSDVVQKGIVTILDIESTFIDSVEKTIQPEAIVAHFMAHTEAIVCMSFDPSGMLLLTADKRGHDFHLFRIFPHPTGPSLAAVHHLYILHRGDTTAKVQDMCFSSDSRWAAVSTLRGTTHVFPVTPYGGNVGVRTHTTQHVVNRMSRFHRSAGLTGEQGRSNSPVSVLETPAHTHLPFQNPRFGPFPHPTIVHALAQIRQPIYLQNSGNVTPRTTTGRQRLSSATEDNIALRVAACFAAPRAYIDGLSPARETPLNKPMKPVESLFTISCHGSLVQYDLEPQSSSNVPKEKICDDTQIELKVYAKAQWVVQRQSHTVDVPLPLKHHNFQFVAQDVPLYKNLRSDHHNDDHWLSQVEIVTHAGPHRRLWMGPQFTFKTYTTGSGSPMSVVEVQPLDVGRSKPVNMPVTKFNPVLIESGSANSSEQSLMDTYRKSHDEVGGIGELQLKEDLADAMLESPGIRNTGGRCVIVSLKPHQQHAPTVAKVVNPLGTVVTVQSDDEIEEEMNQDDAVIHENCDEALFRPVVVPKPVLYSTPKTHHPTDTIFTKSLENNTEVAVKILNKTTRETSKHADSHRVSPKPRKFTHSLRNGEKIDDEKVVKTENEGVGVRKEAKVGIKTLPLCDISDTISDITNQFVPIEMKKKKEPIDFIDLKPLEKIDYQFVYEVDRNSTKEDSDFSSLENNKWEMQDKDLDYKLDTFEDATDCCDSLVDVNKDNVESNKNCQTFETKMAKGVHPGWPVKTRKPKVKLGCRIWNENKELPMNACKEESTKTGEWPVKKYSWNAWKPKEKNGALDSSEKENNCGEIESLEHFTHPKKTYASYFNNVKLIHIDTPPEDDNQDIEIVYPDSVKNVTVDANLLKLDSKTSDCEKQDSSPATDTTESDDSGKLPSNCIIGDEDLEDLDTLSTKNASAQSVKATKRKSKKKRK